MQFTGVNQEQSELVVKNPSPTRTIARIENHRLDAAILGQLDRRDVLFLGPENLTSNDTRKKFRNVLLESFHPMLTPECMVQELLWTLSEKIPAEMVLEGYLPQEWWTVVMDSTLLLRSVVVDGHTTPIPNLLLTDDGWLPVHLLLENMCEGSSSKPQM